MVDLHFLFNPIYPESLPGYAKPVVVILMDSIKVLAFYRIAANLSEHLALV